MRGEPLPDAGTPWDRIYAAMVMYPTSDEKEQGI